MRRFVIRDEQLRALTEHARRELAERFAPSLRQNLSRHLAGRSESELRAAVARGLEHAERRGFVLQPEAYKFVAARLLLGDDFDEALPWARVILESTAPPRAKLSRLFAAMRALGSSHV